MTSPRHAHFAVFLTPTAITSPAGGCRTTTRSSRRRSTASSVGGARRARPARRGVHRRRARAHGVPRELLPAGALRPDHAADRAGDGQPPDRADRHGDDDLQHALRARPPAGDRRSHHRRPDRMERRHHPQPRGVAQLRARPSPRARRPLRARRGVRRGGAPAVGQLARGRDRRRSRHAGAGPTAARIHPADFHGEYYDVAGALPVPRPPQGHPVLAQAGSSPAGIELAGQVADVVFTPQRDVEAGLAFREKIDAAAARHGRPAGSVRILPGLAFVLGSTEAEASGAAPRAGGERRPGAALAQPRAQRRPRSRADRPDQAAQRGGRRHRREEHLRAGDRRPGAGVTSGRSASSRRRSPACRAAWSSPARPSSSPTWSRSG